MRGIGKLVYIVYTFIQLSQMYISTSRSESFKEDKDVLLSRLKIYRGKEEAIEGPKTVESERPPRSRRKSTKSESESVNEARLADEKTRNSSSSSPGKNVSGTTPMFK